MTSRTLSAYKQYDSSHTQQVNTLTGMSNMSKQPAVNCLAAELGTLVSHACASRPRRGGQVKQASPHANQAWPCCAEAPERESAVPLRLLGLPCRPAWLACRLRGLWPPSWNLSVLPYRCRGLPPDAPAPAPAPVTVLPYRRSGRLPAPGMQEKRGVTLHKPRRERLMQEASVAVASAARGWCLRSWGQSLSQAA